jgi:hypothetical protein
MAMLQSYLADLERAVLSSIIVTALIHGLF